jgi:hypothetical protein
VTMAASATGSFHKRPTQPVASRRRAVVANMPKKATE